MARLPVDVQVAVEGEEKLNDVADNVSNLDRVATGSFERIGHKITDMGISVLQSGVSAGVEAIGNSITLASDKAESASKANVIFGDSYGIIEEASKGAAESVGMSSGAYLAAAGDLGNLTTNLGFTGDQAANMSRDMLQLAADVGSFNNASPTEVVQAMGAAFRGEAEPIRRFGVMLSEAAIQEKALSLGLIDSAAEFKKLDFATQSNIKAQATYALILEQTTNAQGDFARTADGLANSQKIANARIEEAWTQVGEKLLPVVTDLVPLLADGLVGAIDAVEAVFATMVPWIDTVTGALSGMGDVINGVGDAFGGLAPKLEAGMVPIGEFESRYRRLAAEAGLTAEEIETGWQEIATATGNATHIQRESADEIVAAYAQQTAGQRAATLAADVAADRAVLNANRTAGAVNAVENAYATAGERLPAVARQVAEDANLADALRTRAVDDMPEAGRQIGHALFATLNGAAVRGRALEVATAIGSAVPGEIADGMVAKSREVLTAGDNLIDLLKNGLTPKEQAMELIGKKYTKAVAQGMQSEIPGAKLAAQQLAVESIGTIEKAGLGPRGMRAMGEYYTQLLAGGMSATEARAALAAQGVANTTIDALEGKSGAFSRTGERVGDAWISGVAGGIRAGQAIVNKAVTVATRATHGMSPPRYGPLRHIDKWGANVAQAWLDGWGATMTGVSLPALGSIGTPNLAAPRAVLGAPAGRGGGGAISIVVQTGVGDPVAIGREVVNAVKAFERANGPAFAPAV